MLFFTRTRDALPRALRAAIAAHRSLVLRDLLESHGETAFAAALSQCSGRVIADALSLLPRQESADVSGHLSAEAQARRSIACEGVRAHLPQDTAPKRPSLQGMLVLTQRG